MDTEKDYIIKQGNQCIIQSKRLRNKIAGKNLNAKDTQIRIFYKSARRLLRIIRSNTPKEQNHQIPRSKQSEIAVTAQLAVAITKGWRRQSASQYKEGGYFTRNGSQVLSPEKPGPAHRIEDREETAHDADADR